MVLRGGDIIRFLKNNKIVIIFIIVTIIILLSIDFQDIHLKLKISDIEKDLKTTYLNYVNERREKIGKDLLTVGELTVKAIYTGEKLYLVKTYSDNKTEMLFLVHAAYSNDKWDKEGLDALNLSYHIVPMFDEQYNAVSWELLE